MDFLNAALAFAVLMITFSTAATALSEAYLRVMSERPNILAKALLNFLKTDPRMQRALRNALDHGTPYERLRELLDKRSVLSASEKAEILADYASLDDAQKDLADHDEENIRRSAEVDKICNKTVARLIANPVEDPNADVYNKAKSIDTLTTYAFVQRFAETDLGKAFGRDLDATALKALTRAFERYMAASNESFRKMARRRTMIAALILAFLVNAPARDLFQFVMDNPEIAERIANDGETAIEENREQAALLQERLEALETASQQDLDFPSEAENLVLSDASDDLNALIRELDEELSAARGLYDLPLGYDGWFDRVCFSAPTAAQARALEAEGLPVPMRPDKFMDRVTACGSALDFYTWVVNILLSGVLIGLGGPFWYRVYASLSQVAQLVRIFRGNPRPESLGEGSPQSQPVMTSLVNAQKPQEVTTADGRKIVLQPERTVDDTLYDLFKTAQAGSL